MKQLFPSLPDSPTLVDVFQKFPAAVRPLLEYHDKVLRSESDLTAGEREMIAAYVSGLNACQFCLGAHVRFARAFGIDPDLIASMIDDLDSAEIDPKLRPILNYVAKLTCEPTKLVEADAKVVFAAGWSEAALYDAIQTCALFNLMNRIVEGTGVVPSGTPESDDALPPRTHSYLDFGKLIGVA